MVPFDAQNDGYYFGNLGLKRSTCENLRPLTSPGFAFDVIADLFKCLETSSITFPKNYLTNKRVLGTRAQQKITAFQEEDHFALIVRYQEVFEQHHVVSPARPCRQQLLSTKAAFDSWNNQRSGFIETATSYCNMI